MLRLEENQLSPRKIEDFPESFSSRCFKARRPFPLFFAFRGYRRAFPHISPLTRVHQLRPDRRRDSVIHGRLEMLPATFSGTWKRVLEEHESGAHSLIPPLKEPSSRTSNSFEIVYFMFMRHEKFNLPSV